MAIFGVRPPKLKVNADLTSIGFSATPGTDTLVRTGATNHGLKNDDRVRLSSTGTLPAGLDDTTEYWVIAAENDDTFKLSTSRGGSIVDITDAGTGTHTFDADRDILLDGVRYLKDEPILDEKEIRFPFLGTRYFLERGNFWRVEFQVSLFKYSDPRAKFEELYFIRYKNKLVEIWPHRDASNPILKDDKNTPGHATFRCTNFRRFYLETSEYRDGIIMTFESLEHVYLGDRSNWDVVQVIG